MNIINFDAIDIPYHEWANNVITVWAYRNGRKSGLGPYFHQADNKVGHYIYKCSETDVIYVMADKHDGMVLITYTWCDGHGSACESVLLHKDELQSEEFVEDIMWHLVRKSGSFGKKPS